MFLKEEKDFITGIYRCKDDIRNLKIRVRLDCVKSSAIPQARDDVTGSATGRGATASSSTGGPTGENSNSLEEIEIGWQQRILSGEEVLRYAVSSNCVTKREQKWHREIVAGQHPANQRIFTYTEQDELVPENERDIFSHGEKLATRLESNQRSLRRLPRTRVSALSAAGLTAAGAGSIVDENPSEETRLLNRTLSYPVQSMFLFVQLSADLNNEEDVTISAAAPPTPQEGAQDSHRPHLASKVNYHLATLSWSADRGVLTISPDLNRSPTETYKIDVGGAPGAKAARVEYRYCLMGDHRPNLVREILTEQLLWRKPAPISLEGSFEMPRQGIHDVFLTGEILTARGFEYNHLFVQYYVHLPDGWSCEDPAKLYGVTQRCSFGRHKTRVSHFSFPFEMKLSLNLACLESEDSESLGHPHGPQLLFEVGALDSWGRYRSEGYAWTALPRTAGRTSLDLACVRPAARGPLDELCRAFIGSSLQIADVTYVGKPASTGQSSTLSKHGFTTVPSGILGVTLNISHQSHVTPRDYFGNVRNTSVYLLERLSANTLLNNVNAVIEAFQRARQRMLLVRQPLMSGDTGDLSN